MRLLPLTSCRMQYAEAAVAVGLKRTHAEGLRQTQALVVISSGLVDVRGDAGTVEEIGLGGLPAVLLAALIVKEMDVVYVRWLVIVVVLIAATMLLRSAAKGE